MPQRSSEVVLREVCGRSEVEVEPSSVTLCANGAGLLALRAPTCRSFEHHVRSLIDKRLCGLPSGVVIVRKQCATGESPIAASALRLCTKGSGRTKLRTACGPSENAVSDSGIKIRLLAGEDRQPVSAPLDQQLVTLLRELSELFPPPAEEVVVDVGTFNVVTGAFTGKRSTELPKSGELPHQSGKPLEIEVHPSESIYAVGAALRFTFVNAGLYTLRIVTNGTVTTVPTGESSIAVPVGQATRVDWRVEGNGRAVEDTILLHRMAAGTFTLEVLPLGIVYEPPQFGDELSRASMTNSRSVGSSVALGTVREQSDKQAEFVGNSTFVAMLGNLSRALPKLNNFLKLGIPNNKLSYVGATVTALEATIGEEKTEEEESVKAEEQHIVDLTDVVSFSAETGAGLGPGLGDRIRFLEDVEMGWVTDGVNVGVRVLGWGSGHTPTVADLLSDLEALASDGPVVSTFYALSRTAYENLLALDPLTVSPLRLPTPRFVCKPPETGSGGSTTFTESHTYRTTDLTVTTTFRSTVTSNNGVARPARRREREPVHHGNHAHGEAAAAGDRDDYRHARDERTRRQPLPCDGVLRHDLRDLPHPCVDPGHAHDLPLATAAVPATPAAFSAVRRRWSPAGSARSE